MSTFPLLVTIALSLALSHQACSQSPTPARDLLAKQLPAWLEQAGTPSAAVALIEDGRLSWTLVRGEQSPGQPASGDTLYNVASLTKPVTAELVLREASAGRLRLDGPLAAHWVDPDLADDPNLGRLTARLCLSHQCGLPNWRHEADDGRLRIEATPGERPGYSGEGYEYLARALSALTGDELQALAERRVFGPLGMQRTSYVEQPWFDGRVAVPRGPDGEYGDPQLRSKASAADDLHATIGDFGRFVAAVLSGDGLSDEVAQSRWRIDHDVASQLCAPDRLQGSDCPQRMGFASGWVRFETATDTVFFHGGGDWGERAFALMVPARRLGVVVLTNGAGGMPVVRNAIAELYPNRELTAFLTMQAGD